MNDANLIKSQTDFHTTMYATIILLYILTYIRRLCPYILIHEKCSAFKPIYLKCNAKYIFDFVLFKNLTIEAEKL